MDDIWSIEAWNKVKTFFPNNNNGSKIMITTRLSHLAFQLSGSHDFQMNFLDEDKSWSLLCKIVFGEEICPIELENIGKKIVRNCRGLPLSIVVIGGLLTKSDMTADYWEYTLENLNSLINLENNGHCLQILRMSYKELPIHLKPCFLYMGFFQEADQIHVSELIKLWVAEGFLKPIDNKRLEEVAKEYVSELIHRNLIAVHKLGSNGNVKSFKIHDLLRDLCLREAQKQRFLYVLRSNDLNIPQGINIQRRICIHENKEDEDLPQFVRAMESASLTRSLLLIIKTFRESSPPFSFRLLRVYSRVDEYGRVLTNLSSIEAIFQLANLRYISIQFYLPQLCTFPSSWSLLWNLQTLRVDITFSFNLIIAPSEIWKMPLLRHVMINALEFELPDPPCIEVDIVLENLQTLSGISNFKCSDEVVKRIPNIRTLKVEYNTDMPLEDEELPNFCLNNLGRLQKLESFRLYLSNPIPCPLQSNLTQNLNFPHSIKKLTLRCTNLLWEELATKIGWLPHLEVLKLVYNSFMGRKWKTVEGQFRSLKFLLINECCDLEKWKMDETHFPRLEHLVLECLYKLEEIPLSVGDIPTLQSIQLNSCSKSVEDSAERIKEEQEDNGNVELKVQIGKN